MRLKTYRGRTIKEAVARVRASLGPEALIVSTTPVNGNNGKHGFEIAAMRGGDENSDTDRSSLGNIRSELMNIKEMIYLLNQSSTITEEILMGPDALNLYVRLIRNGIENHYARMFLERACACKADFCSSDNNIKDRAIDEIRRVIDVSNPFNVRDGKRKMAAFIGTTGVGKTTTIAKLAARLVLTARVKVGLIMIDNYRIGAMEQLKTYADIIGIPCFPAFNRKDLLLALRKLEARDVVLIDTAGLSHYDTRKMVELRDMIAGSDHSISSHLLMSVSTRSSEMTTAATNFRPLAFQSYIFTKLDEAQQCGSMINQVLHHRAPISFITTGQNVPEDIEKATKERIVAMLLSNN